MDSMYAYIKGELAEKNIDSIVVEAAGVGYLIYIPTQYFDMLPDEGEDVKILHLPVCQGGCHDTLRFFESRMNLESLSY